jgi:transposase
MFFARKTSPSGQTLQLLESYRDDEGKPRHRVVVSLGDVDIPLALWRVVSDAVELGLTGQGALFGLDPAAAEWVDWVLHRVEGREQYRKRHRCGPAYIDGVLIDGLEHTRHTSLGPELLGLHAWDQLGMPDLLEVLGFNRAQRDAAAVSVINRLSFPVSESGLATWAKTSSLVDLLGEHVARARRDRFYRVSDRLLAHQQQIEAHLRRAQTRHFSLQRTLVLYDLTNSHFEGTCEGNPKARHGANKQKRFDCVQITVGMVFDEYGFGLAHKTFAGNRSDSTTLVEMVAALDKMTEKDGTFNSLMPPTVIVDAGIATEANLKELRQREYAYLVNETRENRKQYAKEFAEEARFEPVPDREGRTSVRVRRIQVPAPGSAADGPPKHDYVVLCKSAERRQKELAIRSRAEDRFLEDIKQLAQRLQSGKLKDPSKIDQAIGRLRQKGSRVSGYYEIWVERRPEARRTKTQKPRSILKWQRHDETYAAGDELLGCYVLRTTRDDLGPERVWQVYTTLSKAEDGFRALKSNLGLRPNRHQTEERADAHVFITVLAYHLLCFILETLTRAGDRRSWPTLRQILQTHQYATVVVPTRTGTTYLIRKPGEPEECHRQIYSHFDLGVPSLPKRIVETRQKKPCDSVVT